MPKGEKWSEEEIDALRKAYKKKLNIITMQSMIPNRTPSAIYGMASRIGFTNPTPWTAEEDKTLCDLYGRISLKELIVKLPGKTRSGVWSRAHKLGLKIGAIGEQEPLSLSPAEAGYLAGFIDGEGSITIGMHRKTSRRHGFSLEPYIAAYNTKPNVLYWIQERTGGTIRMRKPINTNTRPVWEWRLHNMIGCAKLLRAISDYLILKRRQALLVLDFCENRARHCTYSAREIKIQRLIRILNSRGIDHTNPQPQ